MKLKDEMQLLNEDFRKAVIDEIEGNENQARKSNMKKRYDIYKDNTKPYVLEMFDQESQDQEAVEEVVNRAANVSFCRKIIEKKSLIYKDGVRREILSDNPDAQQQLDKIIDMTNFNSKMKKVNKYAELFKNAVVQVMPYLDPSEKRYSYIVKVLQPYLYDVIEDQDNPEIARVYIFSYYNPNVSGKSYAPENESGMRERSGTSSHNIKTGDGRDQIIADSPDDFGVEAKEYVWWSNDFHFTTDEKGVIISGKQEDDLRNPIGLIPFYNFSQDQDGQFWAVGGDDIIDGSILLNLLLSDLFYIAKYQGMGIGYMFGKGVPKNMKVGASSFISLELEEGDPTPQIGFATSSPPIEAHLAMIDKYISFVLETNNLIGAKGSISGDAQSGIHEMIMRAENINDLEDQREMYRDGEPQIFKILARWHNLYYDNDLLINELQEIGRIDDTQKLRIKFQDAQPFMTEKEKLEIIEKRLNLGLDSMIDAIKKDNSDLSDEEAQEKLRIILEQRLKENSNRLKMFGVENTEEEDAEDNVQTEA